MNGKLRCFTSGELNLNIVKLICTIFVGAQKRDEVLASLGKSNVGATVNYRAIPLLNFYKDKYNLKPEEYANSYSWGEGTLTLPLFPSMMEDEQRFVIKVLNESLHSLEQVNYNV